MRKSGLMLLMALALITAMAVAASSADAAPVNDFSVSNGSQSVISGNDATYSWIIYNNGTDPLLITLSVIEVNSGLSNDGQWSTVLSQNIANHTLAAGQVDNCHSSGQHWSGPAHIRSIFHIDHKCNRHGNKIKCSDHTGNSSPSCDIDL